MAQGRARGQNIVLYENHKSICWGIHAPPCTFSRIQSLSRAKQRSNFLLPARPCIISRFLGPLNLSIILAMGHLFIPENITS